MSCIYKYSVFDVQAEIMFVYELWVRIVGHEMPWSRVACNFIGVLFVEKVFWINKST